MIYGWIRKSYFRNLESIELTICIPLTQNGDKQPKFDIGLLKYSQISLTVFPQGVAELLIGYYQTSYCDWK
jgi:hypothetical protein